MTDVANGAEIKTVRMVKRDSKERNVTNGFNGGSAAPSTQQQAAPEAPPPPPLPRGNYHNLHDFLQKDRCRFHNLGNLIL